MDYILVIMAAVLLAFEFSLSKKYQSIEGTSIVAGLRYNMLTGLLTALLMFGINGFCLEFSGYSLILALGMSLCSSLYILLSFRVLKFGGMALYSTFLMSGGMLLPYIYTTLADTPYTITGPAIVNILAPTPKMKPSACVNLGPIHSCSVRTKFSCELSIFPDHSQISALFF